MTIIQDPIKSAIWRFLNHYAYGDALFLAERLFAEVHSDESLFLLATTYYRLGKPKVVQILFEKHGLHQPQCKLLYAQACWDLENYAKAEQVLVGGSMKVCSVTTTLSNFLAEYGDTACFAAALLGRIYQRTERLDLAESCFSKSLQLNPFLWTSFEKMCEAGCKPNPNEYFNPSTICNLTDFKSVHSTHSNGSSVLQTPHSNPIRKKKTNPVKILAPSQVGSNVDASSNNPESQISAHCTPPTNLSMGVQPLFNDEENMRSFDRKVSGHTDSTFLRSTPSEMTNFDSSMDSYTDAHHEKQYTKTQLKISHNLLGGGTTLSPLSSSFGVVPLYETPSPVWERNVTTANTITPTDMAPPAMNINPPAKKMITRQSRKTDGSTAAGKLFLSSENSRRDPILHYSNVDPAVPSQVVTTRRSTRFSNSANSVKENAKKSTKGKLTPTKDLNNKKHTRLRAKQVNTEMPVKNLSEEISKVDCSGEKNKNLLHLTPATQTSSPYKEIVENLLRIIQCMGNAYVRSCHYDCKKAIAYLEQLPQHQRSTSWSISLLARCYFEVTDYKHASKVFQELRRNHPYHLAGLSYYSTTLWHLLDSVALSALAHDLVKIDSLSPETWCAVGNCFSLRRDYESSIKFFSRAVQLAPHYAYAHTFLGHEYAYSDDNERAMACFRKAIHCDPRHYNAWYGIGSIYYKQENFALAEIHYRKALAINPKSPVLLCHLGIVQHAQKRTTVALSTLNNALSIEPLNPLCRFHRASMLFAIDKYDDALKELLQLKKIVPKESLVYFLIGKTYKVLGENHLAMMNFSWALDLDPKGINNHIKEAIDKQQETSHEFMDSTTSQDEEDASTEQEGMQDSDESL